MNVNDDSKGRLPSPFHLFLIKAFCGWNCHKIQVKISKFRVNLEIFLADVRAILSNYVATGLRNDFFRQNIGMLN